MYLFHSGKTVDNLLPNQKSVIKFYPSYNISIYVTLGSDGLRRNFNGAARIRMNRSLLLGTFRSPVEPNLGTASPTRIDYHKGKAPLDYVDSQADPLE